MDNKPSKLRVLMLPWLAHGHVSPFLELAKELTKRNFFIYFCSTPIILTFIKEKEELREYNASMQLIELNLPSSPDLPPHLHTTKVIPPHLQTTLMKAFIASSPSFSLILKDVHPDLIIYDMMGQWVPPMASSLNIPAVYFAVTGATSGSFFLHQFKRHGMEFPFPDIFLRDSYVGKLTPGMKADNVFTYRNVILCFERSCGGIILIKGCKAFEEKFIDYFSVLTEKRIIPVGPLVHPLNPVIGDNDVEQTKIIRWLDNMKIKDPLISCVYIAFGSEYSLSNEDLEELAYGIELSNVNFIWVIRCPLGDEKISVEDALPDGFIERVVIRAERGMVIDGWAPQARILGHENIDGYVSHCGWGSMLESLYFGVPIIAMPMQVEHPIHARLVEEVGVGVEVLRDENDGKFKREEIARAIKKVVVEKSGEEIRKKAKEVSKKLRVEGEEAPNGVAEELTKLCQMKLGLGV